jgi:hypothetical protein
MGDLVKYPPDTPPPLTLPELQEFILVLADQVLDQLRPPGDTEVSD